MSRNELDELYDGLWTAAMLFSACYESGTITEQLLREDESNDMRYMYLNNMCHVLNKALMYVCDMKDKTGITPYSSGYEAVKEPK